MTGSDPTELHRYDTVPLEMVATLPSTRCSLDEECGLEHGHSTPCAVVSPVGLVHSIIEPTPALTGEEETIMQRLYDAHSDLQKAADEIDSIESELARNGPARVRDALTGTPLGAYVDWPIPDDTEDWPAFLDGRY